MMPDHYENLSQSVIAANLMSTNILSSITTRDYWNTVNDYKPLMHLWYVGIIFEFYVILPILFLFSRKIAKRFNLNVSSFIKRTLVFTTLISLGWYLMPDKMVGDKFYLITTRFFELGLGGMIGLNIITPPLLATKEIDKNIFSDLTYIAPSRFFI